MMTSGGEVSLIGGDAQSIDLRVGMLNRPGADPAKSFPESWARQWRGAVGPGRRRT